MSSTASAEGPLDVSGPVRGEIVVSLSAALRRHLGCRRGQSGSGAQWGGGGQEMKRIKVIADAED